MEMQRLIDGYAYACNAHGSDSTAAKLFERLIREALS